MLGRFAPGRRGEIGEFVGLGMVKAFTDLCAAGRKCRRHTDGGDRVVAVLVAVLDLILEASFVNGGRVHDHRFRQPKFVLGRGCVECP